LASFTLRNFPKFPLKRRRFILSHSGSSSMAADDLGAAEENSMIIRNSSTVRATESIWTHQRVTVRQNPLESLEPLAARIQCARGEEIYKEDSPVDYWYRVISGVARRFSARADGRRQIVDLLLPGDVFGFGASGKHHFAVEAAIDGTVVARYPRSRLDALAESDARIARELRDAACEAMSRLHVLILNLGRTTAEEKVGHFLLKIAERLAGGPADMVVLPISREDIADYLALSVETVSRSLTQLKRRGVIRLIGTRQIRIIDRRALAKGDEDQFAIIAGQRPTEPYRARRLAYSDYD
jgi:CRP/FNR family nitrogen fixation transcriptional regulator